ncbi:hypothetical protein NMY22_g14870 [Coprinellus aureogranulatus]|nr:hypothetical protein NMY22_g14870 [Coprinellus aureogranulatus]
MDPAEIATLTEELIQHFQDTYPRPRLSRAWLARTIDGIVDETEMPFFDYAHLTHVVGEKILNSRLEEIVVPGTGLHRPADRGPHLNRFAHGVLEGPILLEITHIIEVGEPALDLEAIRQERVRIKHQERMETVRRVLAPGQDDQPVHTPALPCYPRRCLKIFFTDGSAELEAVECERLPGIALGETPMGRKIFLTNVPIIAGVAYLHPANVADLGGEVPEREIDHSVRLFRELETRAEEELYHVLATRLPPQAFYAA